MNEAEFKSHDTLTRSGPEGKSWRRSPAFTALAIIAPFSLGLSACSGIHGTTYGTGKNQDTAVLSDITGGFGILPKESEPAIDYSARAGLVLPPDGTTLPTPQDDKNRAASVAGNWPNDPDVLRRAYEERMATMTDEERKALLEAIRKLPPAQRDAIIKNNTRSATFAKQIKEPEDLLQASAAERKEYDRQVKERLALIRLQNGVDTKSRKYLTQPPENLTEVSPEVQAEIDKISPEGKTKQEKSFLGTLWPF